jgi:hypothetical protein
MGRCVLSVCYYFVSVTIVLFIFGQSNPDQADIAVMDPTGKTPPSNFGFLTACMPPPHCDLSKEAPREATYSEGSATQLQRKRNAEEVEEERLRAERPITEAGNTSYVLLLVVGMVVLGNLLYVQLSDPHFFKRPPLYIGNTTRETCNCDVQARSESCCLQTCIRAFLKEHMRHIEALLCILTCDKRQRLAPNGSSGTMREAGQQT